MLADVARIDLIVADGVLAAEGPAAAEALAEACVALTGALRLSSLQAVMQMILAVIRAALGDLAAAQRLVESALAQPDRAPDVPAHASMVRAFPPLLAGDLARADELMRPGMQSLLAYPAAPPLSYLGLWALLCAVCGDDEPARVLARRGAGRRRVNRAALAYAHAVDAGRVRRGGAGRDPLRRSGTGIGADTPWWTRLLRMLALHAALADGWAAQVDAVGALRADLAEHERLGDHQLARTCRDLLRRAGAPTRRGRGATPVPPALRAAGVTSREMDVLALVADGLSNAEVASGCSSPRARSRRTSPTCWPRRVPRTGPSCGRSNSVVGTELSRRGFADRGRHDTRHPHHRRGPGRARHRHQRRPQRRPGAPGRAPPGDVDLPARHRRQHPDDGDLPLLGRDGPDPRGRPGRAAAVLRVADAADRARRRVCRSASRPTRAPCSP